MRRLLFLATLALVGVGCSVPGGGVTTATPDTIEGRVPVAPTLTVPPEFADGDPVAGKVVFTTSCATCHVLSDAGATGTIGPNLDETRPELGLTVDRVVNGKGVMPAFKSQLTPQQIAAVSAYVTQATAG